MTEDRDRVWKRDEPDSPCQAICLIDPSTKLCLGCNRTADEIAGWSRMTPAERAALTAELPLRRPARVKRRGRRAKHLPECEDSEK